MLLDGVVRKSWYRADRIQNRPRDYLVRHGEAPLATWCDHPIRGLSELGECKAGSCADAFMALGRTSAITSRAAMPGTASPLSN